MADGPKVSHPGEYEQALQVAYESFLAPGDVAIDVGAHRGRHTVPIARRVLPGGRVLAFEPLPSIRAELEDVLRLEVSQGGASIQVFPYALGERAARAEFVVAKDTPECSGLRERVYDVPTALERIPVEVRTLDELAADLPRLRYVKIDAEGGEYHIVAGARGLVQRLRPIISFEFGLNSCARYEITPADMSGLVEELGYRCFDIMGRDVSAREAFVDSATRQEVWDYLAIPSEQLEVLQGKIRPALERFFSSAPPEKDLRACRARLEPAGAPERISVAPGQVGRIQVRVTNASPVPWEARSLIRLGIQWHPRGKESRLGEDRAELPLPMAPGATAVVAAPLRPLGYREPLPRGEYDVWISPLIENVAWFTDGGDAPLRLPVTVA
ncbi:MAG TPA: FkbM family methyltransferase [Myxococcales bacterium]|nr:FkbM family methyltransferase [Myxococcales bacterium]